MKKRQKERDREKREIVERDERERERERERNEKKNVLQIQPIESPPREGRSRHRKNASIVDSILCRKSPIQVSPIDLITFSDGEAQDFK